MANGTVIEELLVSIGVTLDSKSKAQMDAYIKTIHESLQLVANNAKAIHQEAVNKAKLHQQEAKAATANINLQKAKNALENSAAASAIKKGTLEINQRKAKYALDRKLSADAEKDEKDRLKEIAKAEKKLAAERKKNSTEFKTQLRQGVQALQKIAMTTGLAASAMVAYTIKTGNSTTAMYKFAKSSGIAYDALQELEYAAKKEGAGAGDMTAALEGLNKQLGDIAMGGGNQEVFRRLGLSVRSANGDIMGMDEMLMQIAERIQHFPTQMQAKFVSDLGFGQEMLQLLQKGPDAIRAYRKEARMMGLESDEAAKKAEQLFDQMVKSKQQLTQALIPLKIGINNVLMGLLAVLKPILTVLKHIPSGVWAVVFSLLALVAIGSSLGAFAIKVRFAVEALKALRFALFGIKAAGFGGILGGSLGSSLGGGMAATIGKGLLGFILPLVPVLVPIIVAALSVGGLWLLANKLSKARSERVRREGAEEVEKGYFGTGMASQESIRRFTDYKKPAPSFSIPMPNTSNSKTVTYSPSLSFNISGAGDPETVAKAVHKELTKSWRTGLKDFESAVV